LRKMIGNPKWVSAAVLAVAAAGAGAIQVPPSAGQAHSSSAAVVSVVDFRFAPDKVRIPKGRAVRWVWSPRNKKPHDVYLAGAPSGVAKGSYSSRRAVKNAEFKRTFKTPGAYDFICSVHPGMHLEVKVSSGT
jgi:plastocyanin